MDPKRLDTICELQVRFWSCLSVMTWLKDGLEKFDEARVDYAQRKWCHGIQHVLTDDPAK